MNEQPPEPAPLPQRAATRASCAAMILAAAAVVLGGCASGGRPKADEAQIRAYAARGYVPGSSDAVATTAQVWPLDGQPLRLVLTRPVRGGDAPLVVYLPGLGEPADAGAVWRTAWAQAGYAVVSVQPLADDLEAWRSELAREGEFRTLGQRQYGGAAMQRRVERLADILAEARRRAAAGDAAWQGLDWSRVAVAGFDLGAYTAMALAGEQVRGAEGTAGRVAVRATIALSPYANVAEGGIETRYLGIRGPVLSVTSDSDGDPLGLVAGAAQRQAPFEHMPGPDGYLLSLQGLTHAGLGGGTAMDGRGSAADDGAAASGDGDARGRGPGGGGGGGSNGRRRGGNTGGAGSAEGGGDAAARERPFGNGVVGGLSATAVQLRIVAARDVSIAFLDAYLKGDALARDWLNGAATGWLGATAELRRK
jgi:dienelactone hydrolase